MLIKRWQLSLYDHSSGQGVDKMPWLKQQTCPKGEISQHQTLSWTSLGNSWTKSNTWSSIFSDQIISCRSYLILSSSNFVLVVLRNMFHKSINITNIICQVLCPCSNIPPINIPRNMFPPNIVAATMHQTKIELIYPGEENVSSILRGLVHKISLRKYFS